MSGLLLKDRMVVRMSVRFAIEGKDGSEDECQVC